MRAHDWSLRRAGRAVERGDRAHEAIWLSRREASEFNEKSLRVRRIQLDVDDVLAECFEHFLRIHVGRRIGIFCNKNVVSKTIS